MLQADKEHDGVLTIADVFDLPSEVPETVRVWRRRQGSSETSCDGEVIELDLEEYVKGVLPAEWMASWEDEALQAGAIAARTYASFWVDLGGKYACADLDDGTWTQVYKEGRHERTDAAVEATEGVVVRKNGSLVYAEYSAENAGRTKFGVFDEVCQGQRKKGHGKGMCQWGTQRWAGQGKDASWMVEHYFPGARAVWPDEDLIDGLAMTVTSGERFELALSVKNTSDEIWAKGSVTVGTEPSAFEAKRWSQPTRPTRLRRPVQRGDRAQLSWMMKAPDVEEPTLYAEFFYLDGPASDRPGAAGTFNITVVPAPAAPETLAPASPWTRAAPYLLAIVALLSLLALIVGRSARPR